jgi:adenosylcobinamide-GDP ribazoletransferase
VRTFLRAGRGAITFLTRLPVGGFPYTDAEWRWAPAWFPAVGGLLGLLYAGVWRASEAAGPFVAAVLVIAAALVATGAFHEDGLADTADALGGGHERARVLEILKDSRIGAFGAAALVVVLLLRVALLVRLGAAAPLALVLAESLSRAPSVWLMVALPYVTAEGAARSRPVTRASWPQAAAATIWPVAIAAAAALHGDLGGRTLVALAVVTPAVAALCAWRFRARVGGLTGDFLGATQQVEACAILLTLVLTSS